MYLSLSQSLSISTWSPIMDTVVIAATNTVMMVVVAVSFRRGSADFDELFTYLRVDLCLHCTMELLTTHYNGCKDAGTRAEFLPLGCSFLPNVSNFC